MDFFKINEHASKEAIELIPDFRVIRSKDLMVRAKSVYAVWDEELGMWSTDEFDVVRLVDSALDDYARDYKKKNGVKPNCKYMRNFSSTSWRQFKTYLGHFPDSSRQLDENLTFSNTEVKKTDYVSRRLPYPLEEGSVAAWDEIIGTLYTPEERAKIEWAIGAVVSGDSKRIQKFLVLYGPGGTGKSTILNIVQKLFEGYTAMFEAKALTGNNNSFSTEVFKDNPLVAIQHDGDLSKIEDNTKLNSIISHEDMTINEKFKPSYSARVNAFLFMGTNKPVKITDAKSGIIRRLIDVQPTGDKLAPRHYQALMSQIEFELGAIAQHCLSIYREMGKNFYDSYRPTEMMLETDIFFNFIEENYGLFKDQDGVSLNQGWKLYLQFIEESGYQYKLPKHAFRSELRNYFKEYRERAKVDNVDVRSWYSGFKTGEFKYKQDEDLGVYSLSLDSEESLFDAEAVTFPAQYASAAETPKQAWADVLTTLNDIDTTRLHYVRLPENHIVIDFDLKDDEGNKSAERNLAEASKWPSTYAEYSKGGGGIHLHYFYEGDTTQLANVYSDGIEVKTFHGGASLRRRLSRCNTVPIAAINSGLPIKERKMLDINAVKTEKGLRDLIDRNLRKEIHPGTKPSIDFIAKILEDAYSQGLSYDVSNLRSTLVAFANQSSNNALYCLRVVKNMKLQSEDAMAPAKDDGPGELVFYDIEVYPNLFIVCWSSENNDTVVKMRNPTPQQVEELLTMKLVGFNNRRYDNHILYARMMGYSNEQLYQLSKKIVEGTGMTGMFREAYGLSYTDIYDYSSKKQSLKKFEIELGIPHMEMDIPWDQPVPDELIEKVEEYCANDVRATKAVHEARHQDFVARLILAELSGLPVNSSTQAHTAKIIFGDDKNAQAKFVYTDLSTQFPGYVYDHGTSTYRGEVTGEGGYVYAEPGMYENVALLDVASMHPTSIENLDAFGPYTENFSALKAARIAIKRKQFDDAKKMLDGKLEPYLKDEGDAEALSYALKIVINIVYGLTSASFDNPFRDKRNKDNIVAKRGALFMIDLKHFVQEHGFTVAHIKTDSIKIPNATPEIIDLVMEFGKEYGYEFEHEATYERFCLVNDAVYIAKVADGRKPAYWSAVGAQFQHPYVFKTLFTHDWVDPWKEMPETKQVQKGALYLDHEDGNEPHFIGRVGRFVPVIEGGAKLVRIFEEKAYAAAGTKGYLWMEAHVAQELDAKLDMRYYDGLTMEAINTINKFGDFQTFVS